MNNFNLFSLLSLVEISSFFEAQYSIPEKMINEKDMDFEIDPAIRKKVLKGLIGVGALTAHPRMALAMRRRPIEQPPPSLEVFVSARRHYWQYTIIQNVRLRTYAKRIHSLPMDNTRLDVLFPLKVPH